MCVCVCVQVGSRLIKQAERPGENMECKVKSKAGDKMGDKVAGAKISGTLEPRREENGAEAWETRWETSQRGRKLMGANMMGVKV